jgi:hypothetical protein
MFKRHFVTLICISWLCVQFIDRLTVSWNYKSCLIPEISQLVKSGSHITSLTFLMIQHVQSSSSFIFITSNTSACPCNKKSAPSIGQLTAARKWFISFPEHGQLLDRELPRPWAIQDFKNQDLKDVMVWSTSRLLFIVRLTESDYYILVIHHFVITSISSHHLHHHYSHFPTFVVNFEVFDEIFILMSSSNTELSTSWALILR